MATRTLGIKYEIKGYQQASASLKNLSLGIRKNQQADREASQEKIKNSNQVVKVERTNQAKIEAAKKMGVDVSLLTTANGMVANGGNQMTYAEALANISDWSLPDTPELRDISNYKFVGKPVKRIDLKAKVVGKPLQ